MDTLSLAFPTVRRLGVVFAAWLIGWVVYMVAMVLTVYDGILSIIFQPIIAALVSGLCVGVSFVLGLIFKIPAVGKLWRASQWPATLLLIASACFMLFGSALGLTQTLTDPESGAKTVSLHPGVALACYFVLIFSIVNFPLRQPNAHNSAPHRARPESN